MAARVVILGAGTGGTLTANRLRKELPDVTITVVDENDRHVYQPGLLFVPFGLAAPRGHRAPSPQAAAPRASTTASPPSTTSTSRPSRCTSPTGRRSTTTCSSWPPAPASSPRRPRG